MNLDESELRRYSRHLVLPEIAAAGQQRLKSARVLIVGAGGLGCPAALYLAAAGVGTLGLLDCDRVDESNLQRQILYDSADIGAPGASARAALQRLNPHIRVNAHQLELCAANVRDLFAGSELILDGSDRIATRYLVNDACVLYRKSLVTAAIYRFEGQAMSYVPDRAPCYRCLFPQAVDGVVPNCEQAGVLGVLPGVLGTLQATEAIKLLLGIGEPLLGRFLTYDALSPSFHEFRITRRADCAICGDAPTITEPVDPPWLRTVEEAAARAAHLGTRRLAARLTHGNLTLIDVREPAEFALGHLPRAINIPLAQIEQQLTPLPQVGPTVFICRSGVRSLKACALARRAGVSEPLQLEGDSWPGRAPSSLRCRCSLGSRWRGAARHAHHIVRANPPLESRLHILLHSGRCNDGRHAPAHRAANRHRHAPGSRQRSHSRSPRAAESAATAAPWRATSPPHSPAQFAWSAALGSQSPPP